MQIKVEKRFADVCQAEAARLVFNQACARLINKEPEPWMALLDFVRETEVSAKAYEEATKKIWNHANEERWALKRVFEEILRRCEARASAAASYEDGRQWRRVRAELNDMAITNIPGFGSYESLDELYNPAPMNFGQQPFPDTGKIQPLSALTS